MTSIERKAGLASKRLALSDNRTFFPGFSINIFGRFRTFRSATTITFTMAKRKAEVLSHTPALNGSKKIKQEFTEQPKPTLLDDSDSDNSSDESDGGAKLEEPAFNINEEFARRFEHNSRRAEMHKCKRLIEDLCQD